MVVRGGAASHCRRRHFRCRRCGCVILIVVPIRHGPFQENDDMRERGIQGDEGAMTVIQSSSNTIVFEFLVHVVDQLILFRQPCCLLEFVLLVLVLGPVVNGRDITAIGHDGKVAIKSHLCGFRQGPKPNS